MSKRNHSSLVLPRTEEI